MTRFPQPGRALRAIGFDDAPFERRRRGDVGLAGVVCAGTRFEGLVWGRVRQDGWNATEAILALLLGGKFLPQLHLVLLDGIGFGGFNLVDLEGLAAQLGRPCVAVMRRQPDLVAMERAIRRLPRPERRLALLARAGAPAGGASGWRAPARRGRAGGASPPRTGGRAARPGPPDPPG